MGKKEEKDRGKVGKRKGFREQKKEGWEKRRKKKRKWEFRCYIDLEIFTLKLLFSPCTVWWMVSSKETKAIRGWKFPWEVNIYRKQILLLSEQVPIRSI